MQKWTDTRKNLHTDRQIRTSLDLKHLSRYDLSLSYIENINNKNAVAVSGGGRCLPGGVCPGGECLPHEWVSAYGVSTQWSVCPEVGVCQTHLLWTESQTGVKTLPCRNYVAEGNKIFFLCRSEQQWRSEDRKTTGMLKYSGKIFSWKISRGDIDDTFSIFSLLHPGAPWRTFTFRKSQSASQHPGNSDD